MSRDDRTEVDPAPAGQAATGSELAIGSAFAGYVIEDVAGRGGMGVVYKARQLRPARTVALKVVSPELADDAEFRSRFEHECEIAASIEHSNVIPVYEVGDEAGRLYIAMRYVEGTDLRAVIRADGPLTPARATAILSGVAAALDAAHARGLVHRDIKPGNVLLAREGEREHVYLTDFGLTRPASSAQRTRTGMFVGTLDYAAPEQLEGRRVDARTDVYAAGCMLFEMLTGRVPFEQEHEASIIWAHMASAPPSIRTLVPGLPPQLDVVISRAMAKTPQDRYPSAGDLGRAAAAAAAGGLQASSERSVATGRAAPTEPGTPPPVARRSRRGLIAAAVVGTVALVAVLAVILSGALGGSSHQRTVTVRTTPTPTVKAYRNPSLGIGFSYPASWAALGLPGAVVDFGSGVGTSNETRCAVEIERGAGPADPSQEAQFAFVRDRSAAAARAAKSYELRAIQAEPAQNITGVGLVRIDGTEGAHLGFFFRGRDVYVFDCITPAGQLDQVDREQFTPLLHSVRIGA